MSPLICQPLVPPFTGAFKAFMLRPISSLESGCQSIIHFGDVGLYEFADTQIFIPNAAEALST